MSNISRDTIYAIRDLKVNSHSSFIPTYFIPILCDISTSRLQVCFNLESFLRLPNGIFSSCSGIFLVLLPCTNNLRSQEFLNYVERNFLKISFSVKAISFAISWQTPHKWWKDPTLWTFSDYAYPVPCVCYLVPCVGYLLHSPGYLVISF